MAYQRKGKHNNYRTFDPNSVRRRIRISIVSLTNDLVLRFISGLEKIVILYRNFYLDINYSIKHSLDFYDFVQLHMKNFTKLFKIILEVDLDVFEIKV